MVSMESSDSKRLQDHVVCVTGASGFLGSAIVNRLESNGYKVLALSRKKHTRKDTQSSEIKFVNGDLADWIYAIELSKPKIFISCDWDGVAKSKRGDLIQIENYTRIINLAKVAKAVGVETFLAFGTQSEVNPEITRISESAEEVAQTEYGRVKISIRKKLEDLFDKDVTRFIWGRVFTVYGPGDKGNSLVSEAIHKKILNQEYQVHHPNRIWSFLYIDDFLDAVTLIIRTKSISGIVNIGNPQATTVGNVAKMIAETPTSQLENESENLLNSSFSSVAWIPETQKLSELLWSPQVKLDVGLNQTFIWWSEEIKQNTACDE